MFGRPQFFVDGAEVSGFNTRKDCALLAYLAATGTAHSREHLAGLLWTDQPEETARRNLRHALSQLQKVIGPGWIETAGGVGLSRRLPWSVDVQRLAAAVAGLSAPAGQDLPALEQALAAYRGEFLQGFYVQKAAHFEEWVLARREEYHLLALRGLEVVAQAALQDGDPVKGLAATRRLLQLEPWSESAHCLQMQLLVATGQRAAALAQYESCRQVLAAELGVEPMPATTALYQQIQTGQYGGPAIPRWPAAPAVTALAAAPPAPPAPHPFPQPEQESGRPPHNLLAPLAAFVGRQAELDFICRQLSAPGCRLLTIAGPGGMGKSSLAQAVGQQLLAAEAADFPDGIFWVPLAEIGAGGAEAGEAEAGELILRAIAAQLDNALGGGAASAGPLHTYLYPRRLLLIVDEFEHLAAGTDAVVTLLAKAPQVKLVVTSRVRLNVRGEMVLGLANLSLPAAADPTQPVADSVWQASEAIAMFVQRARQLDPTFAVDAATLAPVWQICRLVDGLPLGIELAASMLPLLGCRALAGELAKSLDFLAADTRDLPRDQRTLRAVFERSWRLLTPEGQLLLARLAIFPGSFQRAAPEYVAGASMSLLQYLLNQSLLAKAGDDRYAMHHTIHAFARQKLQQWPAQIETLQVQYAHYYLEFLARREGALAGLAYAQAVQEIETDLHNVQAAWRRAVSYRMAAELNRCLHAMYMFSEQQRFNLGIIDLYAEALHGFAPAQTPDGEASAETTLLRGRLYSFFGVRCVRRGRFEEALAAYASSWSILQQLDNPTAAAACRALWGLLLRRSDLKQAAAYLAQAVRLIESTGEEWIKAMIYPAYGEVCLLFGSYAEAEAHTRRGGALAEQVGFVRGIAATHRLLGRVFLSLGRYGEAEAQLRAGIEYARRHYLYMLCLEGTIALGEALRQQGRLDEARACFVESRQLAAALGGGLLTALVLWEEGCLAEQCGEYAAAKACFVESTAIGLLPWLSHALPTPGWALIGLGEPAEAHAYFQAVAAAAQVQDRIPVLLDAQLGLLYLQQLDAQQVHTAGPTWSAEGARRLHDLYRHPAAAAETRRRIAAILGL